MHASPKSGTPRPLREPAPRPLSALSREVGGRVTLWSAICRCIFDGPLVDTLPTLKDCLYSAHGRYNDDEFLADPWRVEHGTLLRLTTTHSNPGDVWLGPGHEEGTNDISDVPHLSVEPQ